jgi:hypothetical protein
MGNTLGTCWNKGKMKKIFLFPPHPSPPKLKRKPMGNTLGTCWNKGKMKKKFLFPPPFPPPKLKRKKQDTLSAG